MTTLQRGSAILAPIMSCGHRHGVNAPARCGPRHRQLVCLRRQLWREVP